MDGSTTVCPNTYFAGVKAALYHQFKGAIEIATVADPVVPEDGALIEVRATGICRSDWYGWQGYDPDISLPHVPGHEWAGLVLETGSGVSHWKAGDRVTAPFVCACGVCVYCHAGDHQVCPGQTQPGFTHWGSFAEYVIVRNADTNLVGLPASMHYVEAASLGCRFGTSYRAVVDQSNLTEGQWIVVFGCGGVGLSAIVIADALGLRSIAVDISQEKLDLAQSLGATHTLHGTHIHDIVDAIKDLTDGGAHASLDALGHHELIEQGILSVRKRGRHIQVGLMEGNERKPRIPMPRIIADEIEVVGSHGIQAHRYQAMFELIERHRIDLSAMISQRVDLAEGAGILQMMDKVPPKGVAVIDMTS